MNRSNVLDNPIHTRVVLGAEEGKREHHVYCARRATAVPVETCEGCAHGLLLPVRRDEGKAVRCEAPQDYDARVEIPQQALSAGVGQVMRAVVACAREDTRRETLERLLIDEEADAVPVVDTREMPIGIVSKTDLLRAIRDGVDRDAIASDVMTPLVHAVPESAPVSLAMALLAYERVEQLPVVTDRGVVMGLVTASDCVAWLAKQLGYILER